MDNVYNPRGRNKTTQEFIAGYNADINAFVSHALHLIRNTSVRLTSDTTVGAMCINALSSLCIGGGLTPTASPESTITKWSQAEKERFSKEAEAFYRLKTDSPNFDYYKRNNFKSLQVLAFKEILRKGDILSHRMYRDKEANYEPCLQIISGQWLGNPMGMADTKKLTAGVEFNEGEQEIAYHIAVCDENRVATGEFKRYPKYTKNGFEEYSLILLEEREANQVRGIPFLATAKEDIILFEAFKQATVAKQLTLALLTAVIKRDKDSPPPESSISDKTKDLAIQSAKDSAGLNYYEDDKKNSSFALGTGNVITLEEGEDISTVESKLQGEGFKEFTEVMLSLIGSSTYVPYEELVHRYSASFSASKATIASGEKIRKNLQNTFANKFCKPEYDHVIDYGIRTGYITAPGYLEGDSLFKQAVLACSWIGPPPIVVDPLKEVKAQKMAIDSRIKTMEKVIHETTGRDFEETIERIKQEQNYLIKEGLITDGSQNNGN